VALEKVRNNDYDIVLMDIQMPVMDGFEATKAIRMGGAPKNKIPIIALTANATPMDMEKCLNAGMNDCIGKPFTPENLFSVLAKYSLLKNIKHELTSHPSTQKLVDLSHLQKIADGNPTFVQDIVDSFLQSIQPSIQMIKSLQKKKDWENMEKVVHKIKPTLSMVGMNEARDLAIEIENQATKHKNEKSLVELSKKFCDQLSIAEAELKELMH